MNCKMSDTAFKNWINLQLLEKMGTALKIAHPGFDQKGFVSASPRLEPLELKDRVRLVRDLLHERLPQPFSKAIGVLLRSLDSGKLDGFDLWPYTEYVQTYGLEHFDESMRALYLLTQKFTAEFAVRPFIKKYPERTLKQLEKWAADPNEHVRRWVSEGTRPRLPWGERLDAFTKDPSPTLVLLKKLRFDDSLYVRKSVANHLNDISKDHPELLVKTLKAWLKEAPKEHEKNFQWIKRHSLRTLIKNGHPGALALMGVSTECLVEVSKLQLSATKLKVGDTLGFSFEIRSRSKRDQSLIIDYVVHHMKANLERTPKVFKLKSMVLKAGETQTITKRHSLKPITTRKYYSGEHWLEIQVNGKCLKRVTWNLALAQPK